MKKIYAQNDLQVVLQNFLEPGGSVTLVLNEIRHVPFIKREIIHMLGTPSWDDHTLLRYSEPKHTIRLVSKADEGWRDKVRGMPEDEVFYVEGWNVDDVRHSPYCGCSEPDEASGYYVSAEGKLVEDNICDTCGKRISDEPDKWLDVYAGEPVSAEGDTELDDTRQRIADNASEKMSTGAVTGRFVSQQKPLTRQGLKEFKREYVSTWVTDDDK